MVVSEVLVRHKLDDVTLHLLLERLGIERLVISVQHVHRSEVSIADANDDDGKRKIRATNDLINCFLHVTDDAVGQNHKQVVLLVVLGDLDGFTAVIDVLDDLREVCWPVELGHIESTLICFDYTRDAIALRPKVVSIQGKLVIGLVKALNAGSKSISRNQFVRVIVLKDATNSLQRLQVLIKSRVAIMQRLGVSTMTI